MKNFKAQVALVVIVLMAVAGIAGYMATHTNIKAGYVGYVYDRTIKVGDSRAIPGTSVIDKAQTGRIFVNPITQEVYKYPTVMVERAWTNNEEGKADKMQAFEVATREGKNVTMDIYFSVRPEDVGKLIAAYGGRDFDSIVDQNFLGLAKGKLSSVTQNVSVYDIQKKRSEVQRETFEVLGKELLDTYGVRLERFEIGTALPPSDIQAKIDKKTEAINAVELAKLDRQKQDETNQKVVDEQRANSEKEKVQRQAKADAKAYEIERAAAARVVAAESEKQEAAIALETAKINKQAELEKQKAFTSAYFRDRQLDNQALAVETVNDKLQIVVTDSASGAIDSVVGFKNILGSLEQ